jgi:hypothetical protein
MTAGNSGEPPRRRRLTKREREEAQRRYKLEQKRRRRIEVEIAHLLIQRDVRPPQNCGSRPIWPDDDQAITRI